jgi:DNA-binding transcriptional LysR family regulator
LAEFGVPKRVQDLDKHRHIAVRFLAGQISTWAFNLAGSVQDRLPAPAAIVVSDPQAAVEAAVSGMGIAQAGVHHAWEHLKAGSLKVVLAKVHHSGARTMALQYPHRALVAPRVRVTVDFLLKELSQVEALHVSLPQLKDFSA